MLRFGLKIAWFVLSATGLLSSILGLSSLPLGLNNSWISIMYGTANAVLQVTFCLGMIWKMDPYHMPLGFCKAQSAIMSLCWLSLTAITSCVSFATSFTILRPAKLVSVDLRSALRWRIPFLCLLIVFPAISFAAYVTAFLKLGAIRPSDDMNCDVVSPVWIRLLSYAGTPLILAVPSFLLSCTAGVRLFYNRRSAPHTHHPHTPSLSYMPPQNDKFTSIPLRRQPHSKSAFSSQDTDESDSNIQLSVIPVFQNRPQQPSPICEASEPSSVATSGSVARAIPSPTPSMMFLPGSHMITTAGRLPSSPPARKSRYHLPFTWRSTASRSSSESRRDINSSADESKSPSSLMFASPSEAAVSPRNSSSAERRLSSAAEYSVAMPRSTHSAGAGENLAANASQEDSLMIMPDGRVEHNDANDQSPGGSIRWVTARDSNVSSIVKSELVFATVDDGVYKREPTLFPGADEASEPIFMYRPKTHRLSVESSTWGPTSSGPSSGLHTSASWRILGFQLLTSATQVLATLSSLIDMFAQRNPPSPFGTQHVALLLAAWGPAIAFGVVPWRRKSRHT